MNRPWIPYSAQDFIDSQVKWHWSVFEWGSGESTLYFSDKCASVITVEHDESWIRKYPDNVMFNLIKPEPASSVYDKSDPDFYYSGSVNMFFEAYVKRIDSFMDSSFDLVLVDGRARPSCIKHAVPKIRPMGFLVVDNTDRAYYLEKTRHLLEGFDSVIINGQGHKNAKWECSIFRRIK